MTKNDNKQIKTKLNWLPKKTFQLEFTIPWKKAEKTYQQVLKQTAAKTAVKGFRKGKAPLKLVEKGVNKQKIYDQVIQTLLPETYQKAIKQHNLQPITSPKIEIVSLKEKKDWKFRATSCEKPEVKLGDYQKVIKGELAKEKIWTPNKEKKQGKKEEKDSKKGKTGQSYDQKIRIVSKTLLKTTQVEISDILIENEVNRMLSRLLDQVNSLGMTIDQYLSSKGSSSEKLRKKHQIQAEKTLKLEFILQQIVKDKKIKIKKEEVDKMIDAAPQEKIKKELNTPLQRAYISSILAKRKVLDYLTNL